MEYSGTQIGTLIHLVMENIDIKRKLDKSDLIVQLKNFTSKNILTQAEERFIINRYLDKIEAFYNSKIGIRLRKSDFIKREVPFVLKKKASEMINNLDECDDILIQGIIDCYFYEGDDVVIVDYKTDTINDSQIEDIKLKYRGQIALYKEALEKIEKKNVKEAYLYLMSLGKEIEI
jgi:ATP-dependent helicase/nuclease subunit A